MSVNPVRIVLQGEMAIEKDCTVKAPITPSSIVLVLYHKVKQFTLLANFDDYVEIPSAMDTINKTIMTNYNVALSDRSFKGTIVGGTNGEFSHDQKELILKVLSKLPLSINTETLALPAVRSLTSQIAINTKKGEVSVMGEKEMNYRLEYLQLREIGEWKKSVDANWGDANDESIVYFEIKNATRQENDIPDFCFETKGTFLDISTVHQLEGSGFFKLPLDFKRSRCLKSQINSKTK